MARATMEGVMEGTLEAEETFKQGTEPWTGKVGYG